MAEPPPPGLELPGCTPEPLMAYLKALGILRLVSEQKDRDARGWWKNDVFWLRSTLDRHALEKFFLEEYRPTPIVAPWAGGSGFFKKDNKAAVTALAGSTSTRAALYRTVIQSVQAILGEEKVGDKPKDDDKDRLIRRYRRELPDDVIAWIDAAMVVQQDGQGFAPLLGTGGNDGRLDFTQNFMQRIVALGLHEDASAGGESPAWLAQSVFSSPAKLDSASVGQFAPGRAGGPNATQGMEGDSTDNPWDFILMMEGALLLAGAAVRRLGVTGEARAAFPFTVRTVAAGFDSPASKDEAESRGELWLPLWTRPTSASELRQLFGEGRADIAGRAARDGADFARAVAGLGVDRGISEFSRLGFLKRSGKAFLAAPLGRFEVAARPGVDLLREVDPWLERFRRAAGDKNAPPRFGSAIRRIDSAIFDFCKYGGAAFFQRIIVALGAGERALASAERFREDKQLKPLAGLSADWINAAADRSSEFAVARALASVDDRERKIGPLRANLEPVHWQKRCRAWAEKERSVVWTAADLATNLANVLQRRMMDGARAGCERLPLASRHAAPLGDIAAFIAGELDDQRIEELIRGLMLIDTRRRHPARAGMNQSRDRQRAGPNPLPREYALLKLLFLPRPLVPERSGESVRWRLAHRLDGGGMEGGLIIRPEPRILPLLRAGRVGEACRVAAQRLRMSGLVPMPGPLPTGVMRDDNWSEGAMDSRRAQRLAAALLIPISSKSVNCLVDLVCRGESAAAEALALAAEGETE
ncbi:MAG: type I-U CRISPR-associated protein Csx17 [Phycisphaerae bacterium]|jgi:CRISPR-associated protein Csx17